MLALIAPLSALLGGVGLLLLGSGLFGTLLAVRGELEGFSAQTIGLITSSYFVGFFLGTFFAPALIRRIGHIRSFAFCAAGTAALTLAHAIFVWPLAWLLLRIGVGALLVVLYTVIESWLNASSPPARRAQVFSAYMLINLGALALGQQFLRVADAGGFVLFAVVSMLVSLAVMPVAWTRLSPPAVHAVPRIGLRALYRTAPSALVGTLASGLALGAFWGLGPLYAADLGLDPAGVASFMGWTIVGGAALQFPLGRLSDRRDRRSVLAAVGAVAALATVLVPLAAGLGHAAAHAAMFAFGGLSFAVYPLSVAHLIDRIAPDQVLAGSSSLLLVHGVASAIGPGLAGAAMTRSGQPGALLAYAAVVFGAMALYVGWRRRIREGESAHDASFLPMLRTTPTALELMPAAHDSEPAAERARPPA